jgi:hypothetical protein
MSRRRMRTTIGRYEGLCRELLETTRNTTFRMCVPSASGTRSTLMRTTNEVTTKLTTGNWSGTDLCRRTQEHDRDRTDPIDNQYALEKHGYAEHADMQL